MLPLSKLSGHPFSFERNTPIVTHVYVLHLINEAQQDVRSGKLASAERLYRKCIWICSKPGDVFSRAALLKCVNTNYASLLVAMGMESKAKGILEQSVEITSDDPALPPMDAVT